MPSSEGISTRVSVLGDKEYKKALQDIGRRLTMLNTEMAATNSAFGDQAEAEGFPAIAAAFRQIAKIEKVHAERFKRFAQLLEQGKLFVSDVDTAWICLNCGHVHHGKQAPAKCPVCQHSQGYFIRLELSPYEK